MIFAEIPSNDSERVECLKNLRILDTESERIYNDLVDLAAEMAGVPICLVSLIDKHRQWFKAKVGITAMETPRNISFCSHAILSDQPMIVRNALEDPRFFDNPLVTGSLKVRFYAGFPIILANGLGVGTLCLIDHKSNDLNSFQIKALTILRDQINAHFNARASEIARQDYQTLIEHQKLKIASAAKMASLGEMAAGIAHEINNPLAAMLAWAGEIKSQSKKGTLQLEKAIQMGDSIERIGLRISKTIQALKNFAREGSTAPLENCCLNDIIEETLDLCRQRFEKNQIQLVFKVPLQPIYINARAVEISQVLLNLLNNAFDAVALQHQKWVKCEVIQKEKQVDISILDSGFCPPLEIRDKIMNPFFTTKPVGQGTGLGLSISQRIAQAHGGSLFLDQNEIHTNFILRLPLEKIAA